jgi:hypothetical protein
MVFIYVLELEQEKYYVGKTNNPSLRTEAHFTGEGSYWTKKYKPKTVINIIPDCDDYDEDKYTLKYMEIYGIENVRGGSFCEIELNDNVKNILNRMISGTTNKCYKCGDQTHFANECINQINEKCNCTASYFFAHLRSNCLLNGMMSVFSDKENKKTTCFRCGRYGHLASTCYAKTRVTGSYISRKTNY